MVVPNSCNRAVCLAVQSQKMRVAPLRSISPTTSVEESSDDDRSAAPAPSCSAAPAGKARRGGYMVQYDAVYSTLVVDIHVHVICTAGNGAPPKAEAHWRSVGR